VPDAGSLETALGTDSADVAVVDARLPPRLDLPTDVDEHRRVLAVLAYLDDPGFEASLGVQTSTLLEHVEQGQGRDHERDRHDEDDSDGHQ
jgi:hypothetical protein